jgi:hypothetical protein
MLQHKKKPQKNISAEDIMWQINTIFSLPFLFNAAPNRCHAK